MLLEQGTVAAQREFQAKAQQQPLNKGCGVAPCAAQTPLALSSCDPAELTPRVSFLGMLCKAQAQGHGQRSHKGQEVLTPSRSQLQWEAAWRKALPKSPMAATVVPSPRARDADEGLVQTVAPAWQGQQPQLNPGLEAHGRSCCLPYCTKLLYNKRAAASCRAAGG